MAQSILAGLDALRLSHSSVPWPSASTTPRASSSSSSAHQSFAGTVTLNQLIYVPDLAEDLWARTRASLAASLDLLDRTRGPRPEAAAAVKRAVETVQLSLDAFAAPGRTRTWNEAVVERKIGTLAESLHVLIPALDALVEYDTDEHTATVEQRMRVMAAAPVGPQRRRRHGAVTVDLMLCRSDPSAADAEPTPVMSLELKSPQASQGCDEPPGAVPSAGLFVRLEALLSEGLALSLDDLASDPPLARLLAKVCTQSLSLITLLREPDAALCRRRSTSRARSATTCSSSPTATPSCSASSPELLRRPMTSTVRPLSASTSSSPASSASRRRRQGPTSSSSRSSPPSTRTCSTTTQRSLRPWRSAQLQQHLWRALRDDGPPGSASCRPRTSQRARSDPMRCASARSPRAFPS